ncbi:MAG TPA: cyclic nucleotide-binding domain-containing protein [Kofleriaceae bacterium]
MSDVNLLTLRRMLRLRKFPPFEHADLDELATIAENLVETTLPAGSVIATPGSRLRSIHLILDGRVETRNQSWGAHQAYGALEVFADREVTQTAVAATPLHTLQLFARDLGEVLEDNYGVLLATVRELAARVLALAPPPPRRPAIAPTGTLGLVERLIVLRHQLPFASARLQALATLAHASDEIVLPANTVMTRAGETATSAFVIISGAAASTHGGDTELLAAGAPIGYLETLANLRYRTTIETRTDVRALRSRGSAILDVIEDHTDVGLAMLATFASTLLDRPAGSVAGDARAAGHARDRARPAVAASG